MITRIKLYTNRGQVITVTRDRVMCSEENRKEYEEQIKKVTEVLGWI